MIAMLSNICIQYNFQVIAIALKFMDNSKNDKHSVMPAYPRTSDQESMLNASVFAGAVIGQCIMGYAGDLWGRRRAMLLTNSFTFFGSLGSALFPWGEPETVYTVMAVCRFILGVGVGGKYPLAATMRSEGAEGDKKTKALEVAKGFFWQTPGQMLPYIVAMLILIIAGKEHHGAEYMFSTNLQFRILLGLGAIPAACVMYLSYFETDSEEYQDARHNRRASTANQRLLARESAAEDIKTPNPFKIMFEKPEERLFFKLIGTGVCWFLYDIVFYGTSYSQPTIIEAVFPGKDLFSLCWENLAVTAFGVPGVLFAIWLLSRVGTKRLQVYGFFMILVSYAMFALTYRYVTGPDRDWINFCVFGFVIFALNWGVNVSTYVLPTDTYPTEVKSSFFGISAGMGKIGAVLGSAVFSPIADAVGISWLMCICGSIALIGVVVTHFFVEPFGKGSCVPSKDEDEAEEQDSRPLSAYADVEYN